MPKGLLHWLSHKCDKPSANQSVLLKCSRPEEELIIEVGHKESRKEIPIIESYERS